MSGTLGVVFDVALAAILIGLVVTTLWTRDQSRTIMLFMGFGGVLALVWVRLRAPDVALAEAAIGSALTGGLLLQARRELPELTGQPSVSPWLKAFAGLLSLALALALCWSLLSLAWPRKSVIAGEVWRNLEASGVSNPVTAVLLNFRAYDTLLEVAVLLVAVVCVWMLRPRASVDAPLRGDPLFLAALRFLIPLLCLLSGYLLWIGAFAPGGAFQAGAVLSAALMLLVLAGLRSAPGSRDRRWLRSALAAGLVVFIAVAIATTLGGQSLLQFPPTQAKNSILLIEAALTISIACTLLSLFLGGRPAKDAEEPD